MLSLLATHDPNGTVIGLNDFPKDEWPPLYVHYLFDSMVGIGFYLLAVPILFFIMTRMKRWNAFNHWMLGGFLRVDPFLCSPSSWAGFMRK
jgi:cytochrome bd ubiquinol oxidase subunit I